MGSWDPGPKWRDPNAGNQVPGDELLGLECSGPKCWDPPSQDPNEGTQILGPKCLDTVMNVHVSMKLTVGTSEHSFKSWDPAPFVLNAPLAMPLWLCPFGHAPLVLPLWLCPFGHAPLVWCPFGNAPLAVPLWPCPFGPCPFVPCPFEPTPAFFGVLLCKSLFRNVRLNALEKGIEIYNIFGRQLLNINN